MDFEGIFICFAIFIIFYGALEIVRKINGSNLDIFNFTRDLKALSKEEKATQITGEQINLGKHGTKTVSLPTDINHVFICGTTGSGKTVTLSNFIKVSIDLNHPLLIIDGKGDVGNGSIVDIVNKIKGEKKLYKINLNSPLDSDLYNPFKNTSPTIIKDMLINLTTWSEEHYKLNMERYLQRLLTLMDKGSIDLSFKNIIKYASEEQFLLLSNNLAKEKIITKEQHLDNSSLITSSKKIVDGAIARFTTIIESELGHIFSDDGIDIYTALEENAIILFILNPLIYPELSTLIGKMIIIDSKKAVSKRYMKKETGRAFFIFDEINVYASKSLLDLVNKSRSAEVTCVLSAQSLSDLESAESESFREQIIENCNNYLILRQNSSLNAELWSNIVGTKQTMDVTYQLQNENGITCDTGVGSARRTREFIIHPDDIKNLDKGTCFVVSKDIKIKSKIDVFKPF